MSEHAKMNASAREWGGGYKNVSFYFRAILHENIIDKQNVFVKDEKIHIYRQAKIAANLNSK